ncbi:hypothetical protein GF371_02250 [Candidatus Woesearchaeota archaeon]|nr:hypothetical protein [Candidatus Woesearchaeota archaeon]
MNWDGIPDERKKYLQGLVGSVADYEIFLGHDIDNAELGKQKIPFYEKIAQIGDRLGHKIFVPYRSTKFPGDPDELSPEDTHDLLAEVMIPHCKLLICYLGINSTSVGHFIGKAMGMGKELIYFLEEDTRLETVEEIERIVLGLHPEDRENVLRQPRVLFNRTVTGELYRYPHIKEIFKFRTEKECLHKLEAAIKRHLIT